MIEKLVQTTIASAHEYSTSGRRRFKRLYDQIVQRNSVDRLCGESKLVHDGSVAFCVANEVNRDEYDRVACRQTQTILDTVVKCSF